MSDVEELNSSELGTKQYWDRAYTSEIQNYNSHGDVGEIWFDEDSQLRIIRWLLNCDKIELNDSIIDLGCGNGMMLIELAREGFTKLTGIDYSSRAIELSNNIAKDQDIDIMYKVVDLLSKDEMVALGVFKIVHDKGTYDAISLHPENSKEKRKIYIDNVYNILQDEGLFIITSCNWTQPELIVAFKLKFDFYKEIPTPSFRFAGKVGNIVTSLVFQKLK